MIKEKTTSITRAKKGVVPVKEEKPEVTMTPVDSKIKVARKVQTAEGWKRGMVKATQKKKK